MVPSLEDIISDLPKVEGSSIQGLIQCVEEYVASKSTATAPSPTCDNISFLGRGSYSLVYRIHLTDGAEFAASVSKLPPKKFVAAAKLSEIATIKFVRESGLYPHIPVPAVHAWDTTFTNPAAAPYVLMDVAQGETLDKLESGVDPTMRGFDALSTAEQIAVTKSLAKLKAALSKPVPFNKIGSLTFDNISGEIVVGPLTQLSLGKLRGGPFESVEALWRSYIEKTMIMAIEKWPQRLKYDAVPVQTIALDRCSPQKFSEFAQIVSALVQQFKIPSAYRTLVLHHPDLAFRNIFFDKQSLSTGEAKITGVIDWAGAKILPILLSAQFPEPLMTSCDYPYEAIPGEYWFSVPHDWTCLGDTSKWPKKYSPGVVGCWDLTPSMTNAIRKFYLRGYFGTRYAEQLDVMGDRNISHATIFSDAPFYLKFHEAISSGWRGWLLQEKWIRETYWRLKALPVRDDESLVLGPNVYWSTFRPNVLDLRDFEEVREPDDLATGWEDADSNSEGEEE